MVFWTTGEVVANQAAANGGYRLVVASRVTYQGPPPTNLTAVSNAYTVTVSTQGQVEVVAGLLDGDPTLIKPSGTLPRATQVALTPNIQRLPNRPPELVDPKLVIDPAPDRQTIPVVVPTGNPAVTVRSDDTVSLTFFARDPDGDQLAASWEAACLNKPDMDGGRWTVPSTRMRWDYQRKAWYRKGIWSPPAEALPNDRFRLYCHIQDGRGGELTPSASTAIGYPGATTDGVDVTIIPTLRLAYKDGGGGLSVANFDGSGTTTVLNSSRLNAGTPSDMSWSTSRHGLLYRKDSKPYFVNQLDGSAPSQVGKGTLFGPNLKGLTIQADKLYGVVDAGGSFKVQWMPAPPVGGNQVTTNLLTITGTGPLEGLISSSSQKALISTDGNGKFALVWLKPATPTFSVVNGPPLRSIALSPDNTLIYGLAADGSLQSCPIDLNGSNQTASLHPTGIQTLVPGPGNRLPSLSPNGSFLVYQDSNGEAQLLNLSKSQSAPLNVNNYTDMVWSQE
ncbi:hypothetical protein JST97_25185, partial [bacterium]|nr:hypothetical protein [bacterium]